jgi:hypothetical protein
MAIPASFQRLKPNTGPESSSSQFAGLLIDFEGGHYSRVALERTVPG